jgi:hypothetical protein
MSCSARLQRLTPKAQRYQQAEREIFQGTITQKGGDRVGIPEETPRESSRLHCLKIDKRTISVEVCCKKIEILALWVLSSVLSPKRRDAQGPSERPSINGDVPCEKKVIDRSSLFVLSYRVAARLSIRRREDGASFVAPQSKGLDETAPDKKHERSFHGAGFKCVIPRSLSEKGLTWSDVPLPIKSVRHACDSIFHSDGDRERIKDTPVALGLC